MHVSVLMLAASMFFVFAMASSHTAHRIHSRAWMERETVRSECSTLTSLPICDVIAVICACALFSMLLCRVW